MKLSEALDGIGDSVPYYPRIAQLLGGVKPAIFFCRFYWWLGRQADPDGWIYKSRDEIYTETGMSVEEQMYARKKLRSLKILEEKHDRLLHRYYYRLNIDQLNALWDIFSSDPSAKTRVPEHGKTHLGNTGNPSSTNTGNPCSTIVHTTPENTVQQPLAASPDLNQKVETPEKPEKPPGKVKKKRHDSPNPPDPRIRVFSDKWCSAYSEVLDEKYVYNGSKDTEAVKRALSTNIPIDELITLAAKAWRKSTLFYCKQSLTIAGFVAKINEIRNELKTGGDPVARVSPRERLAALDELIEKSPANSTSASFRQSALTPEEIDKLKGLRAKRMALVQEIAGASK